ncbi:MAG: hypothetical protein JWM02_3392 [Frankiales bacterium]|nr:hypothetical protein [Frankiales bacterium]
MPGTIQYVGMPSADDWVGVFGLPEARLVGR